jgi:hypothetical protein
VGTVVDSWPQLKDGANKVAHQRLSDTYHLITTCVSQFHDDASASIESLEGPSEEGLGLELFKALSDVLMVAFPEGAIVEVAAEAIKGFRDTLIAGISHAEASTAAGRVAHAKEELRRILNDLANATRESAKSAWSVGIAKIPDSLQGFIDANPQFHNAPYDENANAMEEWLSDSIGIRAADVSDPSPEITAALWASFNKDIGRVAGHLKWESMNFTEKWHYVQPLERSQRDAFIRQNDENVEWWEIGLSWHDRTLAEKRQFFDGFENDYDRQQFVAIIGLDLDTLRQELDEALGH